MTGRGARRIVPSMTTMFTGGIIRQACGLAGGLVLLATVLAAPVAGQGRPQEGPGAGPGQGNPRLDTRPPEPGPGAPGRKRSPPGAEGEEADKGVPGPRAAAPEQKKRRSGSVIPETSARRAQLLDELYALLATAPDEAQAKRTGEAIEQVWLIPASPTVAVLMDRAGRAVAEKKFAVAQRLMNSAVGLAPDYPEVFIRRAYLHHSQNEVRNALADLRRALALDPNHFKALEAMAQMLKEIGQNKAALAAFRKLLEVHPHWPGAKSAMDELARDIEGQEI